MFARVFLFAALLVSHLVFAQETDIPLFDEATVETLDETIDETIDEVTLDELMTPDQLATEVDNPYRTEWESISQKGAWLEQDLRATTISPYKEFPVVIVVVKSAQRMQVYHRGALLKEFRTSTGREEWEQPPAGGRYYSSTPNGWYAPQRYVKKYRSRSWDSMMRYSIFFNGGIAIHATSPFKYLKLGKKASAGCVRLTYGNAKWLWNLARSEKNTSVPVYTRSGRVLTDANGNIKRHVASPVLIIVKN